MQHILEPTKRGSMDMRERSQFAIVKTSPLRVHPVRRTFFTHIRAHSTFSDDHDTILHGTSTDKVAFLECPLHHISNHTFILCIRIYLLHEWKVWFSSKMQSKDIIFVWHIRLFDIQRYPKRKQTSDKQSHLSDTRRWYPATSWGCTPALHTTSPVGHLLTIHAYAATRHQPPYILHRETRPLKSC